MVSLFIKFIQSSTTGRRTCVSGKKITAGSIEQYKIVLKLLQEFEATSVITIRILLINRSSLRALQIEKSYWKRFFRNFSTFLYKTKKCYDQYVASVFKVIKSFFNYLNDEKCLPVGQFHKQFRLPSNKYSPIVLTPQQLKFLITDKLFYNALPKNLQRTADIFIFGCTVGLRYADLMRLRKNDIVQMDVAFMIKLHTQKTGTEVAIPLPMYAVAKVEKYKRKAGKNVLPRLSGTNLNLQVKQLIEKAGWTYPLPKIRHRQGIAVEIKTIKGCSYRFCDHITTHTMRRTAITTLLMMGVSETMVRRISGHAAGSKEFYKYVAVVQDLLNAKVKNAFDRLVDDTF